MSAWLNLMAQISPEQEAKIIELAAGELKHLPLAILRDRQQLQIRAGGAVSSAASRLGVPLTTQMQASIARTVAARLGGLGIFDSLLPPARTDLSEIALNPDGTLWLLKKGERFFEEYPGQVGLDEIWRSVEALLAPIGRTISEAQPTVDAKLPRMEGMGGARIKIIHPVLAPGLGYPAVNIRLFEPRPVPPEQIVQWDVCSQGVMDALLEAVARGSRVLIIGGTGTGKTTLLSALAHGIPRTARIVKIEDPEEVWLPHRNVVTLEARPHVTGSEVPGYALSDGVNDAMRMSPNWLIVGEVRTGTAALSLFRAQMSDHPGLSTLHAESPEGAVHRMSVLLWADAQVRTEPAKEMFAMAIDLIVQVGWRQGRRKITGIWEVNPNLRAGNVTFRQVYQIGDSALMEITRRKGEI